MKKFLQDLKRWIWIWIGFLLIVWLGYFFVDARSWLTATPGDKLTTTTWNNLINKVDTATDYTFTWSWLKTFICQKNFTCSSNWRAPSSGYYTRTTADCWWTYNPSQFNKCYYAVVLFWPSAASTLEAVRPSWWKNSISVYCQNPGFTVWMNYLCRN